MSFVCSFPPVVNQKTRILILGTMPGIKSLAANQYYAHPQNKFWDIMGELYGAGRDLPYEKRIKKLLDSRIGLWESLASCVRPGSLDSSITDEVPNDFVTFFKEYPAIKHIYFNGQKAASSFQRHIGQYHDFVGISFATLPSTSPAHAGMKYQDKLAGWRVITQI